MCQCSEIEQLLTELTAARGGVTESEHSLQLKERDLFEERRRAEVRYFNMLHVHIYMYVYVYMPCIMCSMYIFV